MPRHIARTDAAANTLAVEESVIVPELPPVTTNLYALVIVDANHGGQHPEVGLVFNKWVPAAKVFTRARLSDLWGETRVFNITNVGAGIFPGVTNLIGKVVVPEFSASFFRAEEARP